MALTSLQYSAGTVLGTVCPIPPGPGWVTLTNGGTTTANLIYYGFGTTLGTASGHPIPASQSVSFQTYSTSKGGTLFAIAVAASSPLGVTISSAQ